MYIGHVAATNLHRSSLVDEAITTVNYKLQIFFLEKYITLHSFCLLLLRKMASEHEVGMKNKTKEVKGRGEPQKRGVDDDHSQTVTC